MVFIVIGVLLIVLKLADIAPVATMAWWWVLSPFALATFVSGPLFGEGFESP